MRESFPRIHLLYVTKITSKVVVLRIRHTFARKPSYGDAHVSHNVAMTGPEVDVVLNLFAEDAMRVVAGMISASSVQCSRSSRILSQ